MMRRSTVWRLSAQVKAASLCGAGTAAPLPSISWCPAADLQHTYCVKEFERQVFARLGSVSGVERLSRFTISDKTTICEADEALGQFQTVFTNPPQMSWDTEKVAQTKGERHYECDLYLRAAEKPVELSAVFRGCADAVVKLNDVGANFESVSLGLVLCEVAETPRSLRKKLWQLERAVRFGPEALRSPAALVVCLNGDPQDFNVATGHVRSLLTAPAPTSPIAKLAVSRLPVFCVWTQYRNVYAEIKELKCQSESTGADIKDLKCHAERTTAEIKELKYHAERTTAEIKGLGCRFDELIQLLQRPQRARADDRRVRAKQTLLPSASILFQDAAASF